MYLRRNMFRDFKKNQLKISLCGGLVERKSRAVPTSAGDRLSTVNTATTNIDKPVRGANGLIYYIPTGLTQALCDCFCQN